MKPRLWLSLATALLLTGTSSLPAQVTTYQLSTTFTNPTPAFGDFFGRSVAAVGADKVLIGAEYDANGSANPGAAYLFSINGTLLTTITNPVSSSGYGFGFAVAAVGADKLLIGAFGADTGPTNSGLTAAGAAYLFSTSGTLLTTFTNPFPAEFDHFGYAVTGVGADKVLIGAIDDQVGEIYPGAAYLFSTNGTLLTTITNPTPADGDYFGWAVAALGSDKLIIGALGDTTDALGAGAAYLYNTNGTLLTTFTKPTPAINDLFGAAVAPVGTDKVLIGAYGDSTGAVGAGAAYLFNTNGTLLTTFTNPTPALNDNFGRAVTSLGADKVLVGAPNDDTGAVDAGTAYLFNLNGTLLNTITNPTPESGEYFGAAVAALGADKLLIGAYADNTGAGDSGSAYLFNVTQTSGTPTLSIRLSTTNTAVIYWPSPSTGYGLQQNTNDVSSVNWSSVLTAPLDDGLTKTVIVNPPDGNRFYRLFKP